MICANEFESKGLDAMTIIDIISGFLGAGKTTLMRLLSGLLKKTGGEILYNGENIENMGMAYRKVIGYLPQTFGYYEEDTAEYFLLYLAILKDLPNDYAKDRVSEVLELVGLTGDRDRKLKNFSGGMIRRVGIAQALLNDPQILILDEPTSGLDPMERVRFRNIISSLSRGKIIILSTHIVTDIEQIADKILLMKQGKIVVQGTAEDILKPIENMVWEASVKENIDYTKSEFIISNLKKKEGTTDLRIISGEMPVPNAYRVEPTLEDAYLYYRNIHEISLERKDGIE